MMKPQINEYKRKPWPKLEVPPLTRRSSIGLLIFVVAIIILGWVIYLRKGTSVEQFTILGIAIPILFFFKSRWVTIIGLLSFQVIVAFLFMGNSEFALYCVLGLVGIIIAFESPLLVYAILVFWVFFEMSAFSGFFPYPLKVEVIIAVAFLVGYLFKAILNPSAIKYKIYFPEKVPLLIFFGWVLMGFAVWCLEPFPAGWYQVKYFTIGVLFFLMSPYVLVDRKSLNWGIWSWIVAGILASLSSYLTEIIGYTPAQSSADWGAYSAALGMQHSWSASYLAFTYFVALPVVYWMRSAATKLMMAAVLIGIFIATYIQFSRGPTLGVIGGSIVFWIADAIYNRKKGGLIRLAARAFYIASFIVLIFVLVYVAGPDIFGNYGALFEDPAGSSTMSSRIFLWSRAYEMATKEGHVIRGLGPGAFWVLAYQYGIFYEGAFESMDYQQQGINPHNLFVDTTLHYGITGLFIYLWLIFLNLFRLWKGYLNSSDERLRYLSLGLFCGLLGFYFSSMFDFNIFIISRYWLFMGLTVSVLNISHRWNQQQAEIQKINGSETMLDPTRQS